MPTQSPLANAMVGRCFCSRSVKTRLGLTVAPVIVAQAGQKLVLTEVDGSRTTEGRAMKGLSLRRLLALGCGFAALALASPAHASKCEAGTVFNPITKVRWNCIFPITIGGGRLAQRSARQGARCAIGLKPLCACRKGVTFWFGVKVSFWSPNRMVDVVTEPGCMMALGADIMPTHGRLQGSQSSSPTAPTPARCSQMHYYISPVWKMLDMFTDLPCIEDDGFDVALITEVCRPGSRRRWARSSSPRHPFRQSGRGPCLHGRQRCGRRGQGRRSLFWCMGSWGATYPIAGDIHFDDSVEAWAGLAARGIFMMGRLGRSPSVPRTAVPSSPSRSGPRAVTSSS
jgi:conjugal transfer pilus assembly protein TraU